MYFKIYWIYKGQKYSKLVQFDGRPSQEEIEDKIAADTSIEVAKCQRIICVKLAENDYVATE